MKLLFIFVLLFSKQLIASDAENTTPRSTTPNSDTPVSVEGTVMEGTGSKPILPAGFCLVLHRENWSHKKYCPNPGAYYSGEDDDDYKRQQQLMGKSSDSKPASDDPTEKPKFIALEGTGSTPITLPPGVRLAFQRVHLGEPREFPNEAPKCTFLLKSDSDEDDHDTQGAAEAADDDASTTTTTTSQTTMPAKNSGEHN